MGRVEMFLRCTGTSTTWLVPSYNVVTRASRRYFQAHGGYGYIDEYPAGIIPSAVTGNIEMYCGLRLVSTSILVAQPVRTMAPSANAHTAATRDTVTRPVGAARRVVACAWLIDI